MCSDYADFVCWLQLYHVPSSSATSSSPQSISCNGSTNAKDSTINASVTKSHLEEEEETATLESLKRAYTDHLYLNPSLHIFLAHDDSSGAVVGVSVWEAPSQSAYSRSLRRRLSRGEKMQSWWCTIQDSLTNLAFDNLPVTCLSWSLWSSRAQCRALVDLHHKKRRWAVVQAAFRAHHVRTEDAADGYWTLAYLAVLPSHGRRGIGQKLLRWGLERADEEDRSIYISASVQGVGLYKKVDAEVLDSVACMEGEEMGEWLETWMCRARLSLRKIV